MQETLISKRKIDPKRSLLPLDLRGDRVMLRLVDAKEETVNGIIKPVSVEEPHGNGIIVCIGDTNEETPIMPKLNDTVMYYPGSALALLMENEEGKHEYFHIIRTSDVIAIM